MDTTTFDERMQNKEISSEIEALSWHRLRGYTDECLTMHKPPITLLHIIREMLSTETRLKLFSDENPNCKTFSQMRILSPEFYEEVRRDIIHYCNKFYYRI